MSKEILCKTFGHKIAMLDSGYPICGRCGAHGYYDDDKFDYRWHNAFGKFLLWRWSDIKYRLSNVIKYRNWRYIAPTVFVKDDEIPF